MQATIKKLSKTKLPAADLKDSYWERLEKLVAKKKKNDADVVPVPSDAEPEAEGAEIVDLMALLQKSLSGQKPANSQARPGVKKARAQTGSTKRKAHA